MSFAKQNGKRRGKEPGKRKSGRKLPRPNAVTYKIIIVQIRRMSRASCNFFSSCGRGRGYVGIHGVPSAQVNFAPFGYILS
jgi:hypothetical protein